MLLFLVFFQWHFNLSNKLKHLPVEVYIHYTMYQDSQNQMKRVTSLLCVCAPCSRVLVTLSVFGSHFFFFLTNNHTFSSTFIHKPLIRNSHVPEIWHIQGLIFNILFQTCIYSKDIEHHVLFMKDRGGTYGSRERNIKIYASYLEVSQIFPHYSLYIKSTEKEVTLFSTKCGEPCVCKTWHTDCIHYL